MNLSKFRIFSGALTSLFLSLSTHASVAPWQTLVTTPAEKSKICDSYGSLTRECFAALGIPQALGKIECVAKGDDSSS